MKIIRQSTKFLKDLKKVVKRKKSKQTLFNCRKVSKGQNLKLKIKNNALIWKLCRQTRMPY